MNTYLRHKDASEIIAQAKAAGVTVDSSKHEEGGDHLVVHLAGPDGAIVPILYNTVSGRFFYAPKEGDGFSSDLPLDEQPWFAALLDFFYSEQAVI